MFSRACRIALLTWMAALAAAPASGQLQLSAVKGVLLDATGQPLPGATIELSDPLGGVLATRLSDSAGRFAFTGVALGRYSLRAMLAGFDSLRYPLNVESALPFDLTLRMALRTSVDVVVDQRANSDSPTKRLTVAGPSIEQIPVRAITKGLQNVVATLPGWATEDNGLLHVRGTDDGFLYVIDGVPVYERLDQLSGLGPNLSTVESVNVVTGYVPAEFGYKAGGVIDVRSKTSASSWAGSIEAGRGSERETSGTAAVGGPLGGGANITVGGSVQRSDRFLDPAHPDNLHNHGDAAGVSGQLSWLHKSADVLTIGLGAGRMFYDVPNTAAQEDAGQDQRQRITQHYGQLTWQRAWSSSTLSQLSAYARRSASQLAGSPNDTPIFAMADRQLARAGAMAALTRRAGSHTIKAGGEVQKLTVDESFLFYVTDEDAAEEAGFAGEALEFERRRPFDFFGRAAPAMWSTFVQDEWTATNRFTVSAGLRFDRSQLLLSRSQWSPRVGAVYRVGDGTVLRGSVGRFFQPPQPENLLLSSSEEARELSPFAEDGDAGGANLEPERQWAFEAGLDHQIGSLLRIDAAFWYRAVTEAADPNVFAGTTIIFPNAVARGRARGVDVRIEMARRRSWSGYANASFGRVRQNGPITGGLFLEDDIGGIAGGAEFVPDHDQAFAGSAGLAWSPARSGFTVSATVRHETGTPIERGGHDEDELRDRPGAERVDFDRGRVRPRTVASLQVDAPLWRRGHRSLHLRGSVLNLFDARYAYNFANPFSGTHFGAQRTLFVAVRTGF